MSSEGHPLTRVAGGEYVRILSRALVALAPMLGFVGTGASAQQQLDVVVEYIAGSNLYIDAGTQSGIVDDDTLMVFTQADGVLLGTFVVVTVTRERAVVTFASDPFPVTRGKTLHLVLGRTTAVFPSPVTERRGTEAQRRATGFGPQVSGRLSVDVNALQTRSEAPEIGVEPTDRTFTTPTARLRMNMTRLPGDLRFQINTRASARYASTDLTQPEQSFRVYQASLAREWRMAQFEAGRFYSPYETFSGYWDGALLRVGGDGFGVGAAVGFQPERSNETFSSNLPKYTAFVNAGHRGRSVFFDTDLSFHEFRPRDGTANYRFIGWSQQLRVGGFQVGHRIQVDHDAIAGKWVVTQLLARSSIPLGRRITVRFRYALRQPDPFLLQDTVVSTRRDQGSAGLSFWLGNGTISADVIGNRVEGDPISYTYSGSFSFPNTALLGLGVSSTINYWVLGDTKAVYASGALSRSFGRFHSRVAYYRYQTEALTTVLTHTAEVSLTFPVTQRLYTSLQGRIQRGENLNSNNLYTGLWFNF